MPPRFLVFSLLLCLPAGRLAAAEPHLPGSRPLQLDQPLDEAMVAGINRFALREIAAARKLRSTHWQPAHASVEAYLTSIAANRSRFRKQIGAVDPRLPAAGIELKALAERPAERGSCDHFTIYAARWAVFPGVTAEGLWLVPSVTPLARVVALPDADTLPEAIAGLLPCPSPYAANLAAAGCEVLVPVLINRDDTHAGNPQIGRMTNQPHREFLYRQAFEVGRHIIGYEVQKVRAAVDQFERRNALEPTPLPIVVAGAGEGGLLAFYSAAVDPRIDGALVSGYFDRREEIWKEPIYRNVWRLLAEFGDAEIARLIAPRGLYVEVAPQLPQIDGPPPVRKGRRGAAPGVIRTPQRSSVAEEAERAALAWQRLRSATTQPENRFRLSPPELDGQPPLTYPALRAGLDEIGIRLPVAAPTYNLEIAPGIAAGASKRQQDQVAQLIRHTQRILQVSQRQRDRFFAADRRSLEAWHDSAATLRDRVHRELIGRLPQPTLPPDPRTRQVIDAADHVGYEVMLDVYPDVIAGGILLLPKDLQPGERRPVVVCQHGLEGQPMDTIVGPEGKMYRAYKGFSTALVQRGFIVYAPQNPYRGHDAFRTIQRKSNPLGRTLFSYILPQHQVTLRWLASLPQVDPQRIGFYGLSYGGKTAVRVPPLLPPTEDAPGYCLSICSADFNRWVDKNAAYHVPFSYLYTGEYEIFEWNMGQLVDYGELAMLMAPRPFMVERGHRDGVGIDPWVAAEYAKVRQHYNQLGIGERTEIEFFDGPHTIHGEGTFAFLHRHLDWPPPATE